MSHIPRKTTQEVAALRAGVLIVDDLRANRMALEAVLADLGHDLVYAASGEEALRAMVDRDFALILLDVMMPGLDGFATAELVRKAPRSHDTPIIFLTAADNVEHVSKAYARGAVDFITKPFNPTILRAKVTAFVNLWRRLERVERKEAAIRAHERAEVEREAARLAAENANRAKDEFLAMVAHELRAPLSAILGYATMLKGGKIPDDRMAFALETIERNARRQAVLIEDLVDISRIETGSFRIERRPVDMRRVVESAVTDLQAAAEAKGVRVEVELATTARGDVWGDPERLEQIVLNLLGNAIKFTPSAGLVKIALAHSKQSLELTVSDSGSGIDPAFLPRVFERFQQAASGPKGRQSGLGLGLAITKHMVKLHGGSITAHSAGEGLGATFSVVIPMRAP